MKYLNFFKSYNIGRICKKFFIETYTINKDGSIDVSGDVYLREYVLPGNKLPLKFNKVSGDFSCYNHQLISLKGSPKIVGGDFDCSYNQLISLKGCPEKIGRDFDCSDNNLTSLEGCPKTVGGYFSCSINKLISLVGSPENVGGDFYCNNNELESFKGCPKIVNGTFYCHNNEISSFEHFPKYIRGSFNCQGNPIYEIWKLFYDTSKIELFNDMDIIQDDTVILDRLNYFLEEIGKIGKPTVKSIEGYKYI